MHPKTVTHIKKLNDMEKVMKELNTIDIEVQHNFAPGNYARTMKISKGVMLTGKIHRHAHLNIMAYGDLTVVNENGTTRLSGHNVFTSEPGTKRAFYAHEDSAWTTIHLTGETDMAKLEKELIMEVPK